MNSPAAPSKILIVDDHPLVREGMSLRLAAFPDLKVCGEASSEDEAFEQVKKLRPDLVIVDISLKSGHGIELLKRIQALQIGVKMLVVSGFQESLYAERAMRAGASGYLNKQDSNEKVIDAIRTVLRGDRFLGPETTKRLVEQALRGTDAPKSPIETLTDREMEIFRMIGMGLTNKDIANQLLLSSHTVDSHRENIKRKLGAKSSTELYCQAVQWSLENG